MNNLGIRLAAGIPCSKSHNSIRFYGLVAAVAVVVVVTVVAMFTARSADAGLSGSISAAKQKEKSLASEVAQMGSQIGAIRRDVIGLQRREAAIQAKLVRTQAKLAQERQRLDEAKRKLSIAFDDLEKRILVMYRTGKVDVLAVLVKSKNWRDFLTRKEFLDRLAEADAKLVGKVKRLKANVEARKKHYELLEGQLQSTRNQLQQTRAGLEEQSATLAVARTTRRSALKSVRGKISSLEIKRQAQMAAVAQPAPMGAMGAPSAPGTGFGAGGPNYNGIVNGIVGDRPGACRDGCSRRHAGTDISAPTGTPVKAPRDCTINFAGTMQGYGLTVRGSCGLFAHLSRIAVSTGQKVSAGTVVGYVGSTGRSSGPHLHYEESDRFG